MSQFESEWGLTMSDWFSVTGTLFRERRITAECDFSLCLFTHSRIMNVKGWISQPDRMKQKLSTLKKYSMCVYLGDLTL